MNRIKNALNLGLQTAVPIILTIAVVVWLIDSVEAFFGFFIKVFIPNEYYYRGMGAVFGLVLVFMVGFMMNAWVVSKFYEWWEGQIKRIPLVKTIYQSIQDVMAFFDKSKGAGQGETVVVELPQGRILGFVTRTDLSSIELGEHPDDEIAVYIPMSYQIGGFMVLLPRSQVKTLNLPAQDAMRFILTAGVGKEQGGDDVKQ